MVHIDCYTGDVHQEKMEALGLDRATALGPFSFSNCVFLISTSFASIRKSCVNKVG